MKRARGRTRVQFQLRLPSGLKGEVRRRAGVRGQSMAAFVIEALRDFLERTEQSSRYRWGG